MRDTVTEAVLQAAADNAKSVLALEESVDSLRSAAASQLTRIVDIREHIGRGVAALGHFARDAEGVAAAIDIVAASAERGRSRVETLAADIDVMAGQVASSGVFYRALSDTISEIVRITAALKENAEDLAVISINTAIEAARAGDKGKGFSVIAREVRKLADRSGELADAIGRSAGDAGAKVGSVGAAVESAAASARSASEASHAFSREFSSIAAESARAKKAVGGFSGVANERLEGERAMETLVKDIAAEARSITDRSDSAFSLAAALKESTKRSLEAISGERSVRHDRALAEVQRLAARLSASNLGARESLDAALSSAFGKSSAFELLYVMDPGGRQISSNVVNPACIGRISSDGFGADRSAKEYFAVPFRTRASYSSPAYLSSASGLLCITAAVPLFGADGSCRGVLAADFDAAGLAEASCA